MNVVNLEPDLVSTVFGRLVYNDGLILNPSEKVVHKHFSQHFNNTAYRIADLVNEFVQSIDEYGQILSRNSTAMAVYANSALEWDMMIEYALAT